MKNNTAEEPNTTTSKGIGSALSLLESRVKAAQQRQTDAKRAMEEEGYTEEVVVAAAKELRKPRRKRRAAKSGMTSRTLCEIGQLDLLEREQRGDFSLYPLSPGAEYPLILTRAPIFLPTRRSVAASLHDSDGSIPFSTGWGEGRKYGPPLTVYDEDTLLALAGLRKARLEGDADRMPIPTKNVIPFERQTRVHALYTTITEVEEFLKKPKGGSGHKRRLDSVHRLASVRIKFSQMSDRSVGPKGLKKTVVVSLIDVQTVEEGNDSFLYVQFPPEMACWLEESFAYIDMDIRRRLSDNGKAIHKHLCGQKTFNIFADTLRNVTASQLSKKNFMRELRTTMKLLHELGWCDYEITGNGRSTKYKLIGRRLEKG